VEEAFSEVRLQDAAYNVPWRGRIIYRVMYRGLMAVVLVAVAVTLASLLQTPTYEASAEVRVDQEREDQQMYHLTRSGQEIQTLPPPGKGVQAFLPTIRVFIDSRRVAEEATQRLGFEMTPEELLDNLDTWHVEGTNFIRLTYEGTHPQEAAQIVNTVGEVSSERISEASGAATKLRATVSKEARVPANPTPVSPDPLKNGLLTLVVGLALCAAYIVRMGQRGS
jgi:capsular polysaccharide biosynthesis protein